MVDRRKTTPGPKTIAKVRSEKRDTAADKRVAALKAEREGTKAAPT